VNYFDLKTGEYKSNRFNKPVDVEYIGFYYRCAIYYFEVEETEAEDISDKLLFHLYQEPQTLSTPESTAVCEDSGQVNQAGSWHKGLF
jgi:hypothetical protein